MAAQGSHALWFDERSHLLTLPWGVKLFISFVPPVSGAAALHLVVKMAERLMVTARLLAATPSPSVAPMPTNTPPNEAVGVETAAEVAKPTARRRTKPAAKAPATRSERTGGGSESRPKPTPEEAAEAYRALAAEKSIEPGVVSQADLNERLGFKRTLSTHRNVYRRALASIVEEGAQ
jgi:hypothetical protein